MKLPTYPLLSPAPRHQAAAYPRPAPRQPAADRRGPRPFAPALAGLRPGWLAAVLAGSLLANPVAAAPADDADKASGTRAATCSNPELNLVVLGSGGPELTDQRASSAYLLREGDRARLLVDFGSGASLGFEQARAQIADLRGVLISHLHVDHINDLPALVKASFFSNRLQDLPILGPTGNHIVPDTPAFIERLFGEQGAYSYLSDFLTGEARFALRPRAVQARVARDQRPTAPVFSSQLGDYRISAIGVSHGLLPALAWRIEKDGCSVVFSGDTSNQGQTLDALVQDADLFVAHNAVPQAGTDRIALRLHMPPAEIGRIAAAGQVRSLLLSHLMQRTRLAQKQTTRAIRERYQGPLHFARDGDIYRLQDGRHIANLYQKAP